MKDQEISRVVDNMLASTPPAEIGDGHLLVEQERKLHKRRESFGSVPLMRRARSVDEIRDVRPPDKRTKVDPEPLERKLWRDGGGTVLL